MRSRRAAGPRNAGPSRHRSSYLRAGGLSAFPGNPRVRLRASFEKAAAARVRPQPMPFPCKNIPEVVPGFPLERMPAGAGTAARCARRDDGRIGPAPRRANGLAALPDVRAQG